MPRSSSRILLAMAGLAAIASGCDALVDRPALTLEFGAPYSVLFGELVTGENGLPQETPFTDDQGVLHVAVQYAGGCQPHTFRLDFTLSDAEATVWLVHASNGEACDALIVEEVVVALPPEVLARTGLILVGPGGRDEAIIRFDVAEAAP